MRIRLLILLLIIPLHSFGQDFIAHPLRYYANLGNYFTQTVVISADVDIPDINYGRFTPQPDEIRTVEQKLFEQYYNKNVQSGYSDGTKQAKKVNKLASRCLRLADRQYYGIINENGDRVLMVSLLCRQKRHSIRGCFCFSGWKETYYFLFTELEFPPCIIYGYAYNLDGNYFTN